MDKPPPTSKPEARKLELTDDEYIAQLRADPTYAGINVSMEAGKMASWCRANGKQPTRRRFINWLNRTDRPLDLNGHAPKRKNCL